MNERIKELADKCYSKYGVQVDPVKFAELIVKDCATIADDFGVHLAGYRDTEGRDLCYAIRDMIRQHFGVKNDK